MFSCSSSGQKQAKALRNMKERREGLGVRFYSPELLQWFDLSDLSLLYGER